MRIEPATVNHAVIARLGRAAIEISRHEKGAPTVYKKSAVATIASAATVCVPVYARGDMDALSLLRERSLTRPVVDAFLLGLAQATSSDSVTQAIETLLGDIPALEPGQDHRFARSTACDRVLQACRLAGDPDRLGALAKAVLALRGDHRLMASQRAMAVIPAALAAIEAACARSAGVNARRGDTARKAAVGSLSVLARTIAEHGQYIWGGDPSWRLDDLAIAMVDAEVGAIAEAMQPIVALIGAFAAPIQRRMCQAEIDRTIARIVDGSACGPAIVEALMEAGRRIVDADDIPISQGII